MICDINTRKLLAEVIYDDTGDEEENVAFNRLTLRISTGLLTKLSTLRIDLSTNLAKCLHLMHEQQNAIDCLSNALSLSPGYLTALYLRGIFCMEQGQLRMAKDDLFHANSIAQKQKNRERQKAIASAWKRLQELYKRRKRADKKIVKEMMKYLSTFTNLE